MKVTTALYGVVGNMAGDPILYHLDQTRERAERLRARREELTGQLCFIVPMAAWRADPGGVLRRARAERRETDRIG